MSSRLRFLLAACGFSAAALLISRTYRSYRNRTSRDHAVADFTAQQQTILGRVREIWDEHLARGEA